jgi:hypothetical protein
VGRLARAAARRLSRRNPTARAAPSAPKESKEQAPAPYTLEVPLGDSVRGQLSPHPAVVMFVAIGLPRETLETLVTEVAALQTMLSNFRPMFVTDCDHFQIFRRRKYLFEYIPPRDDWCKRFGETEWNAFLNERMETLLARYKPDRVIALEDSERFTLMRAGMFDALVRTPAPELSRQDAAPSRQEALVGPFPATAMGQLVKKSCELYLRSRRMGARRLLGNASRFVTRRARTLL